MLPVPPAAAEALFGDRLPMSIRYAEQLAGPGVERGLIGPREVPRLWDRHLLNCAVLAAEFPTGSTVVDVGSGAGLPGLVLAIARPDLSLMLIEPMRRRVTWLAETVEALGLTNVELLHGRAEAFWGQVCAPYVTARAVAPLASLALWCSGLLPMGGWLVAMKGASAVEEVARDAEALADCGFGPAEVVELGGGLIPESTFVVRSKLLVGTAAAGRSSGRPRKLSQGRSGRKQRRLP